MTAKPYISLAVFVILAVLGLWFLLFAPKTAAISYGGGRIVEETIQVETSKIQDPFSALDQAYSQTPIDTDLIGKAYLTALKLYDDGYYDLSSSLLSVMASNGHIDSLVLLADHYRRGAGLQKDVEMSVYLLTQAVDQGSETAAYALGNLYYNGDEGLEPRQEEAKELWRFAASKGYQPAVVRLGRASE